MEKIDLMDITFLIPVRIDSIERLENIQLVIEFLVRHFYTHIHILEATGFNNSILRKVLPKEVQIEFIEDFDPVFHRTHYINVMTRKATSPFCAIWDADVIVEKKQLQESVQILRNGEADFVYPYTKLFLDVPKIIKEHYHETGDINVLVNNSGKMKRMYYPNPVGGAFLVNRQKYFYSGLENESFYGWGIEDGERFNRWRTLGHKIQRVQGILFHFTHSRSMNSLFHDDKQNEIKSGELFRTGLMSKIELENEVINWKNEFVD